MELEDILDISFVLLEAVHIVEGVRVIVVMMMLDSHACRLIDALLLIRGGASHDRGWERSCLS